MIIALKAAARRDQLEHRLRWFSENGLPPAIEIQSLSLSELDNLSIKSFLRGTIQEKGGRWLYHFPVQATIDGVPWLWDPSKEHDSALIFKAIFFCKECGFSTLVIHRAYTFDSGYDHGDANRRFMRLLKQWDTAAQEAEVDIAVENYGYIWLPKQFGREYVAGPLDHFFPWEMTAFMESCRNEHMTRTHILLDIAHATLSANMLNLRRKGRYEDDPRFANILPEDVGHGPLSPYDYLLPGISYHHLSDAWVMNTEDDFGRFEELSNFEGQPIGKGNLDYEAIHDRIGNNALGVVEISPSNNDHVNNVDQWLAADYLVGKTKR